MFGGKPGISTGGGTLPSIIPGKPALPPISPGLEEPSTPSPVFDWDVQEDQAVRKSGTAATVDAAIDDATLWAVSNGLIDYGIVVRDETGATVYSANVKPGTPPTQGEGGSGEAGQGQGQEPTLAWSFTLYGYHWIDDDHSSPDPRLWTGHGELYQLQDSGFVYGSGSDAMAAARKIGDKDQDVVAIHVTANTAGFVANAGDAYYQYDGRMDAVENAAAKAAEDAYRKYQNPGKDYFGNPLPDYLKGEPQRQESTMAQEIGWTLALTGAALILLAILSAPAKKAAAKAGQAARSLT